ncbi:putative monovalent cation/H+ antiporter subunit A [Pararhizobium mangrovi]|uniref:Putative monovalent cation/H+ antiporter subunit A n=1 Tax=Pararhizobium mangrovi TaxID=2590452 RepID=A0A506TZQ8_9HYPH|nr:putative monovalent cation/H+ antiporter subunit A [Pararhizobium mangrovi]TPW26678.1 putative monovalent cation/H+ antiporter subunit A [Pararhizobium mangrovi]
MNVGAADMTLLAMALPFVAAGLAPYLVRLMGHRAAWVLALAPLSIFIHFIPYAGLVANGRHVTAGFDWVPSLDTRFEWFVDGLSLTFAFLVTGIGTLIVLYSGGYMKGHPQQGRFLSFILLFMGSMLGLVLSDDFLMLFVFWELTSVTSFLLIGFDHEREASRRAALQALVVTGAGGLGLLAGLLLIWNVTGVHSLSGLLQSNEVLRQSPYFLVALILVLCGAFTKSAQFPLHFWLPNAMEAPTPVSAYLHSATMVKAGVFLLMRLNPVFADTPAWHTILPIFGGMTLVFGALLSVRQSDLKQMLAYTTMSSLGLMVMMTGFGGEHAVAGAVLYLVAHALFKGALFMVAGIVDHEAGTREVTKLGGLLRAMPVTFAAALAAAVSMGGLPPAVGFLAKEEIYSSLWHLDPWSLTFLACAVIGNALMMAVGFVVALKPFLGKRPHALGDVHEAPFIMWVGPATLGALGIVAAIAAPFTHEIVSSPMVSAVLGRASEIDITLVPHIGPPLALSGLTIVVGIVTYLAIAPFRRAVGGVLRAIGWGPDRGFDQFVRGLVRFSHAVTDRLQPGSLEVYMTVTFVAIAAALLVPMVVFGELPSMPTWPTDVTFYELTVMAIGIIGLVAVLIAHDRLTAIVSLGVQGFAVALLFMLFGAPDLSFTQFMIEALSVVILALVMTRLRLAPSDHRPTGEKLSDAAIAIACGAGFMLYLMRVTEGSFDATLSDFFARYSKTIAHGHNIVNVIIVDFRGTDTLGEISVVMVTGLAILALIRIRATRTDVELGDNDPREQHDPREEGSHGKRTYAGVEAE